MTLADALALARSIQPIHGTDANNLARWILDALGEAAPCGMIWPEVVSPPDDGTDGVVVITTDTPGVYVAADARAYAAALLRAADMAVPS